MPGFHQVWFDIPVWPYLMGLTCFIDSSRKSGNMVIKILDGEDVAEDKEKGE